jgi:ribonuclease E
VTELLLRILASGEVVAATARDGRPAGARTFGPPAGVVGSIYKGRVVNVEPSIQAAFLDVGLGRNVFLHVADLDPPSCINLPFPAAFTVTVPASRRPPIQNVVWRGRQMLVQVIKEAQGQGGPTASAYLSLASPSLVLMPALARVGVSRKAPAEHRDALRQAVERLRSGAGPGFVIRAGAVGRSDAELAGELARLLRLWNHIGATADRLRGPGLVYRESDPVNQALFDHVKDDLAAVYVDGSPEELARARALAEVIRPGAGRLVHDCNDRETLFSRFEIRELTNLSPVE